MARQNDISKWFPVDLSKNPKAEKAYEAVREANRAARAKREAFEEVAFPMLDKKAPEGHHAVLSYAFGRLSVGFKEGKRGAKKEAKDAPDAITI